jgi:hypothetical protein
MGSLGLALISPAPRVRLKYADTSTPSAPDSP